MKKILLISFLITLTIGVTGCLNQDTKIYTNTTEDSETADIETEVDEITEDLDEAEAGGSDEDLTADEDEAEDTETEVSVKPAQSENIIVETPLPNSSVTNPFEISGQARVFEGTVLVRVKNQDGKVVIPEQIVTAHGADAGEFGTWKIKINYQFYTTKEGTIEVFSESPKDGSEINMVEVPVKFE